MTSPNGSKNKKKDSKLVYFFGEGNKDLIDLLGGKGSGLNEMTNLKIPVPQGFTITTEACKEYMKNGGLSEIVQEQVRTAVSQLEKKVDKSFGGKNPLIVSVRSGAKHSMPGMLDTILNLGLNDNTVKHLAEQTNERFAYDCYKRLIRKFSELVLDIRPESLEEYMKDPDKIIAQDRETVIKQVIKQTQENPELRHKVEDEIAYEHYRRGGDAKKIETLEDYLKIYCDAEKQINYTLRNFLFYYICNELKKNPELETEILKNRIKKSYEKEFPQDVNEQLTLAIKAVFKSWNNKRAKEYRKINSIPDNLGTAVNIQAMVFGNRGGNSATGVIFTRSPVDGKNEIYGEYLTNSQGEDLVSGLKTPKLVKELKKEKPKLYQQLNNVAKKLEKHFKTVQDIEFTIEEDKLWVLQTRKAELSQQAELKTSTDMVKEGIITKEEAVNKININNVLSKVQETIDPSTEYDIIAKGIGASQGIVSGEIVFTSKTAEQLAKQGKKIILVREETSPEDIKGIKASIGVLTRTGGSTSHAALITRAMNKCCITGCESLTIRKDYIRVLDGKEYYEGDVISLNGYTGEVIEGDVKTITKEKNEDLEKIIKWSENSVNKKIELNADTPKEIQEHIEKGITDIGLCRTEHLFLLKDNLDLMLKYKSKNSDKNVLLKKMGEQQTKYYKQLLDATKNNSIRIMLLNYSLNHFPSKKDYSKEKNITNNYSGEIEKLHMMQVKALAQAYSETKYKPKVEILIPEIIPKTKRQLLKTRLEEIIPKNEGITINPDPDKTYFIKNPKQVSYEKIRKAETIITKPKNSDVTKVILAKYAIREQNEP